MTTFANLINNNPIYAKRAEADQSGVNIEQNYAKKSDLNSFKYESIGSTAVDLNDLLYANECHAYVWTYANRNNVSNKPSDDGSVLLSYGFYTTSYGVQIAMDGNDHEKPLFIRFKAANQWKAWIPFRDASWINSGTFGTDRIADDAITADKVKDNETLPVNVSGSAGSVSYTDSANGTSYKITGVESNSAGASQPKKLETARFYKDNNNGSILILGNVNGTAGTTDRGMLRLAAGNGHYSNLRFSNNLSDNYDTTIAGPTPAGGRFIPVVGSDGAGSPSTPVYVDANGQVQPCDLAQMGVGNAATASKATSDNNGNIFVNDSSERSGYLFQYNANLNTGGAKLGYVVYPSAGRCSVVIMVTFTLYTQNLPTTAFCNIAIYNDSVRAAKVTYLNGDYDASPLNFYYSIDPQTKRVYVYLSVDSPTLSGLTPRTSFEVYHNNSCRFVPTEESISSTSGLTLVQSECVAYNPSKGNAVGSPSTPVYVDSDGQVQLCTPSSMSVGHASALTPGGTSGQVLMSAGAGSDPVWATISNSSWYVFQNIPSVKANATGIATFNDWCSVQAYLGSDGQLRLFVRNMSMDSNNYVTVSYSTGIQTSSVLSYGDTWDIPVTFSNGTGQFHKIRLMEGTKILDLEVQFNVFGGNNTLYVRK